MLAHVSVAYDLVYDENHGHKPPGGFAKFMLKLFVKGYVVGDKAYKKNGRTAPQFLITEEKDFEKEKAKLIDYLNKTQALGRSHFNNKESFAFGKLSEQEWNNMFYKHIDYHLEQFDA